MLGIIPVHVIDTTDKTKRKKNNEKKNIYYPQDPCGITGLKIYSILCLWNLWTS